MSNHTGHQNTLTNITSKSDNERQLTGSIDLFQPSELANTAFVLKELSLYNWGPFQGNNQATFDLEGTAIIGPTGSGKTTLVDALMTLIVPLPKYNLASTGGHESDRDLISYVRGVTGAGNNSGDNHHIARPGKTITGLAARFESHDQVVQIGGLFWIDVPGNASADLKKLWLFTQREDQTLEHWLTLLHEGGKRAIKQFERHTTDLKVFDSKKSYLDKIQRFFEVGTNAFPLLNRAAGLKQLNSVDEIFRELVLDDRSMFARAGEVATEFDDLAIIHEELNTARRQQNSLQPLISLNKNHQKLGEQLAEQQALSEIIPIWFAIAGHQLWGTKVKDVKTAIDDLQEIIVASQEKKDQLKDQADRLNEVYLRAGGSSIESLRREIGQQEKLTADCRQRARDYQTLARNLDLDDTLSSKMLAANQLQVGKQTSELEAKAREQTTNVDQLSFERITRSQALEQVTQEYEAVKARPGSNIKGALQNFRSDLAEALSLEEDSLPFIAELVEVKTAEKPWRGAIERAIGSHRERILVPSQHMKAALNWINNRHNRVHVRLQDAMAPAAQPQFYNDGFTRKLNFKEHPHREALKALLASIDRHCVESPEQLKVTPHGMTQQGLMSGVNGRYEKQDQRSLNDNWMTGFDNRDRLATLEDEIRTLRQEEKTFQQQYDDAKKREQITRQKLNLLARLSEITFEDINLPDYEKKLRDLEQQLSALLAPDSDATKAKEALDVVKQEIKRIEHDIYENIQKKGESANQLKSAEQKREKAFAVIGDGLKDEQAQLADRLLPSLSDTNPDDLPDKEKLYQNKTISSIKTLQSSIKTAEGQLIRQMNEAQKQDTGSLSEAGTELRDIPQYLERLNTLTKEALPEKQKRFKNYLNQSSDQGVTQLLNAIDNEVSQVEERIEDLNRTLLRVDFKPGQYLQLRPQRVIHESLRNLESARRHLRAASLKEDDGESHYRALVNMVELLRQANDNRRTVGARALLDPRYRLQFTVEVCERNSHSVIERLKGSQSGSGGEKEILASYILTASLSYALCPAGASHPLFGTIVLDEAFSKSSQAVAGRIISALNEFGLHPLFVTPNKEIRLLRSHTRSAILVHRKGMKATLTPMRWETLEKHASRKSQIIVPASSTFTESENHEITP
ncbi:ATP-binding protein [Endozoicomonas elysicola]|uniref:ATP synthase n=1 Tax=Endozoicomonas elysicola TaxID=305900 RepID=A0A081KFS0_9GAMM|nr:ATP-binding protein [Endozoicomonas elysicola]KEI72996.1 ATP synthase [Endozoicomonas elysicola]